MFPINEARTNVELFELSVAEEAREILDSQIKKKSEEGRTSISIRPFKNNRIPAFVLDEYRNEGYEIEEKFVGYYFYLIRW